jgi:AcrR family transcriptional regulator
MTISANTETASTDVSHERVSARERLLSAADELFYGEGINTVGIDRVIAHAGVAKASLYKAFGSKDELIRVYLDRRHAARVARVTGDLAKYPTAAAKLRGFFRDLATRMQEPSYHGCAFIRASAEIPVCDLIREATAVSRGWMRELFTTLAHEAGARDAAGLAAQLVVIYDGAGVAALMESDRSAAAKAVVAVAERLIGAEIG